MPLMLAQATAPAATTPAAAAAAPLINTAGEAEASAHLGHRLDHLWNDLLTALTGTDFYIELGLVALALFLAWITTAYLRRRIEAYFQLHPPRYIDSAFVTKPLQLLGPLVTILFLWLVQAGVTGAELPGHVTNGALQLSYAWLLTRCVWLGVRQTTVAWLISAAIIVNAILHVARVGRVFDAYLDSVALDAGQYHITALHFLNGVIICVVMFWGAGMVSSVFDSYLQRATRLSTNTRHLAAKFFRILSYICAAAITLSAIGIDLTGLAIFSGALGVGIGLGLQKVTSNFVSGVTMLMERSIKIGDLIEVSGYTGWVRQLNIRYALLETSDGREVIIPNEDLLSTRVVNWTLTTSMALIEIKAVVSFESDAEKAREMLLSAATEHPLCLKDPKPNCWIREFTGTGVSFLLTFWIADVKAGRNAPQSEVMFAILKKFSGNGITLAKG